jgi:hypothetical protein
MPFKINFTVPALLTLLIAFNSLFPAAAGARLVSEEEMADVIHRARVWHPVEVSKMDLFSGDQGPGSYKVGEKVVCRYEERDPLKPIGGHSKKFPCHDASDYRLKVKYDPANTPKVFSEVAGTRLYWALGFYAERMYSVKIVCQNCPVDPWVSSATPRAVRVFDPASVQKRLIGEEISETADEGWTFDQLDLVDEAQGGSSRAEVDALKLLSVFAHHGDNTANQQRLLCLKEDPQCLHPLMYVTDLGGTFGGKDNFSSYKTWAQITDIWKDRKNCIANFQGTDPGYHDPKISEAGRKFLADLIGALSDKQIRDLFLGARFDLFGQYNAPLLEKGGRSRQVTVDDWVRLFKKKRQQILSVRCPD